MKKINLFLMLLFCGIIFAQGQEKSNTNINPFRIGLKIGIPNGIGANVEYVTPLLNQRIAVYGDYSGISKTIDDVHGKLRYYEFGSNIYLKGDSGKGLYGSIGYGDLLLEGSYSDAQTIGGEDFTGSASGSFEVSTLNLKVGLKVGRRFFFRTELGYGFGDVPQEVIITGNVDGTPAVGVEEIPDIPGLNDNGYILFNLGFGFAF